MALVNTTLKVDVSQENHGRSLCSVWEKVGSMAVILIQCLHIFPSLCQGPSGPNLQNTDSSSVITRIEELYSQGTSIFHGARNHRSDFPLWQERIVLGFSCLHGTCQYWQGPSTWPYKVSSCIRGHSSRMGPHTGHMTRPHPDKHGH